MLYKRIIIITLLLSFVANLSVGGNVKRKQLIDNGWVFNDKQTVCLPHDWSARMAIDRDAPAGNDGGYYPTGVGIYNKVLNLTKDYEGKKLWLYFEGVYQDSEVRVNGKVAGGHPYGYSSFWCDITELVKTGKNAITEDDDFCGMAVVFELGICRYLLYLATLDIHRNKGLGALTLKLLREETNLPIIGEVEPPTDDITRRRIAFYERNGFHVELEDPRILNDAHLDPSCVLMLISTHPLSDADECQRRVVDTVYKPMQAEEV